MAAPDALQELVSHTRWTHPLPPEPFDEGDVEQVPPTLAAPMLSIKPVPSPGQESRVLAAREVVMAKTVRFVAHGQSCVFGLLMLTLTRLVAWGWGEIPNDFVRNLHVLSVTCDFVSVLCSAPLFLLGPSNRYVTASCFGPALTMTFAMLAADTCAFVGCLIVAAPRPPRQAASIPEVVESRVGIWECALMASLALQIVVCVSSWRIYRELRMAGLQCRDSLGQRDKESRVSLMEVFCDPEDVQHLTDLENWVIDGDVDER